MKYFTQIFDQHYNRVNGDEEQQTNLAQNCNATVLQQSKLLIEKQRRKSLKASRSMYPAGILSSFFNERKNNKGARSPKCAFLLLAVGVLAITTAVLVKIFQPYDLIFKWKLIMEEDGEVFDLWAKPPVDLYIKIYLFNITNAEAFLAGREKLNVQQVGPYVYKEIMTHENITFNKNNTMSTNPSHPLVWQEHMSEGNKEDDEVVMLNIAMLAISHITSNKSYFLSMALNTLFATSNVAPIVRMTAREFMFGYESSLTTIGNKFLPNWIYFDKVGLIDRMYDFSTDFETFYTGATNPEISGLYATYRGDANLKQWDGEHCSNIEFASDGTKFKSFIQPNESVKFFRKSMCRPINLHRSGEPQKYGRLEGYKYLFEENALDNGIDNEKNKCFCRNGYCQPRGLIDVTDCYYGFPISLSYPHFMEGNPGLIENVTGLEPNKEEHTSAFVIQPQSGLPLSISAKIQINMHFQNLRYITKANRFSHLTAPMLWFEIMMPKLPETLDMRFNFYINILPYVDIIGFWGGLLLGVISLLYAVIRATLRISKFGQSGNYGKVNLLHVVSSNGNGNGNGNGNDSYAGDKVYNPCEIKLINTNEIYNKNEWAKTATKQQNEQQEQLEKCIEDIYQTDATDIDAKELYGLSKIAGDKQRYSTAFPYETDSTISDTQIIVNDESSDNDGSQNDTPRSSIYNKTMKKEKSISSNSSGFESSQDCSSSISNRSSWSMSDYNNCTDDKETAQLTTTTSKTPTTASHVNKGFSLKKHTKQSNEHAHAHKQKNDKKFLTVV